MATGNRIERKLIQLAPNNYDYVINENGDFTIDSSFDTDILVSLFADGRADASEIQQPELRRGWIGDAVTTLENHLIGSKLWLMEQARLDNDTLNKVQTYAKDCLKWIIELDYAKRLNVTVNRESIDSISITVRIYVKDNEVLKFTYRIWKNSDYIS
jgi:phage gp46-like protein